MSFMLERNGPENDWDPGLKNAARNLSCLFTWTLKNGFSFCMGKWTVSIIHCFLSLSWYIPLFPLAPVHSAFLTFCPVCCVTRRPVIWETWLFQELVLLIDLWRDKRLETPYKTCSGGFVEGPCLWPGRAFTISAETINYVSQGGKWASCSSFRVGQSVHAFTKHTVSVWRV